MKNLTIPKGYRSALDLRETQEAIKKVKDFFERDLAIAMNLTRVSAPLFVDAESGLNDNLNGIERPVSFDVFSGERFEIVQSLAKWKRMALRDYGFSVGEGLYTDMSAIRRDETTDNIHSLYVDQWDWERTLAPEDRNLDYLCDVVEGIYECLKDVEREVYYEYPHIRPILPDRITFIQSEDLLNEYPTLSSKDRETEIVKKYGAVFVIGIGGELSNGEYHDGRAPDYDDWSTETSPGYYGLNGDILVWNPVLDQAFELSSMGIRVDKSALLKQLAIRGCEERRELAFHKALLNGELPLSIGGGLGQSRLCMYLLRCAHIGEVQTSIWPDEMIRACADAGIVLR